LPEPLSEIAQVAVRSL